MPSRDEKLPTHRAENGVKLHGTAAGPRRAVEVWSLTEPPVATNETSPPMSFRRFQRRVVVGMLTASTEGNRGTLDAHRSVILIGENNEATGSVSIADAIRHDKAFILDRLRPDLICVDFDNVPRPVVRQFVRRHLAGKETYALVPSGGRSIRLPNSSRRLYRYHLFVVAKRPATTQALRTAVKAVRREMTRRADVEKWPARVQVVIRAAIRGPLFAHRFRDRTERLRRYCSTHPAVLSAIVDVFESSSRWTESELTAELDRRDRVVPPLPSDTQTMTEVDDRQLLDILDAHEAAGETDGWSAAYALVNRLEARGFSAEQVWSRRDHPSLATVVRGEYPKSKGAAWRDLLKMFADAARTRQRHARDATLREDVLAAAVMSLQKSAFKVVVAALASERKEIMTGLRSKRKFDRSVWLGQRSLGELAGIGSPGTVSAALRKLEVEGWIAWGPKQPVGSPRPFAVMIPREGRSKLNNYPEFARDQNDRNGASRRPHSERSKPIHDYQLPPSSTGEDGPVGEVTPRARVGVRTTRALLKAHAFRVRGYPASALQYILALLLGIDRQDLPVADSTLRRVITALREDEVLAGDGRLAPNFLEVLELNAVERHHAEAADRQKERNHKQRVAFHVERTMALQTSRARRQRLRRLRTRNPVVAEAVLRDLEKAHGPRWYAVWVP